jgi:hypothetical protein
MAFKIICQKCNQEGILSEGKFAGELSIEEDVFTIRFGNSGGYGMIELTCNKCGNEVSASE